MIEKVFDEAITSAENALFYWSRYKLLNMREKHVVCISMDVMRKLHITLIHYLGL